MAPNVHLARMNTFIEQHSDIAFLIPSSDNYDALRESYILNTGVTPLGIVRPQTPDDVASIVKLCVTHSIPFTVRSGGHDIFGCCFAEAALAIDMRSLDSATIQEDDLTATICGGVLAGGLAKVLAERGLAAPMGSIGSVGYVGWASHGGYGQMSTLFGMGVDGIVGVKIVNAKGGIVDANEEMLVGIRGGGGCLGVIVQMTIKVARVGKVLAGLVVYESSDLSKTISAFYSGYQSLQDTHKLTSALGIQSSVLNIPDMGKCFIAGFLWSSPDTDQGYRNLESLKTLYPTVHVDIKEQTIPEWQAATDALVPHTNYGRHNTLSLRKITADINAVLGKHLALMPTDPATLFSIHELRSTSPSRDASLLDTSVFANRTPHVVLEFIASSSTTEATKGAWEWACAFKDEVERVSRQEGVLLEKRYVSLIPPGEFDGKVVFEERWKVLKGLKRKYDPSNVFEKAMVRFKEGDLR